MGRCMRAQNAFLGVFMCLYKALSFRTKNHTQEMPLRLQPGAALVKKDGLCLYVWKIGVADEFIRVQ